MLRTFYYLSCLLLVFITIGCGSEAKENKPVPSKEEAPKTETENTTAIEPVNSTPPPATSKTSAEKTAIEFVPGTVLQVAQSEFGPVGTGAVASTSGTDEIIITDWRNINQPNLSSVPAEIDADYFIMIRSPSETATAVLSVARFKELPQAETVTLKLTHGLGQVTPGHMVMVFRPQNFTDDVFKHIGNTMPINNPNAKPANEQSSALKTARAAARKSQSINNMKQMLVALHNFHDLYGSFPPAIIYGPDKKPWHSWRTLILPFMGQNNLYERYKITEPWNGPNNKLLLEEPAPVFYLDPIHDTGLDSYTHYAAAVGPDTSLNTVEFDGTEAGIQQALTKGGRIQTILDGTSNTMLIGTISPAEEIQWTEPRDISIDSKEPTINEKGGFAAVHQHDGEKTILAGMGDGSVQQFSQAALTPATLKSLLSAKGGEILHTDSLRPNSKRKTTTLEITPNGDKSTARMIIEEGE